MDDLIFDDAPARLYACILFQCDTGNEGETLYKECPQGVCVPVLVVPPVCLHPYRSSTGRVYVAVPGLLETQIMPLCEACRIEEVQG